MPDVQSSGSEGPADKPSRQKSRTRHKRGRGGGGKRQTSSRCYAALDLGTNNCRLLIARDQGESFKIIDSYSRVVRLGQGLTATGKLSEESMNAAIEAIGVCVSKMKARRVKRWRCVATEACRKASNGKECLLYTSAST